MKNPLSPTGLRAALVRLALEWKAHLVVMPAITCAISEFDAGRLMGMTEAEYAASRSGQTAVSRGHDFVRTLLRYQVKANRPSGKRGSFPTKVNGVGSNWAWDRLIWIRYDKAFQPLEAYLWEVEAYRARFGDAKRITPEDMRGGLRLDLSPIL